ncbi:hypothetical protein RhiirA5_438447 [Rhizophagus irregularis]|uniref:Uncharacterized protein n=1 Tax=Rhizophagus irregularis TaxID=588596 RepID=A0A2N0NEB4_9GLOM|nr:hypothetical protein RhiirA5_443102 [Rhizophagus irregularis]PKB94587.1 hypothetical protein RhiirA5_438447 [Rhizophagus irregularis]
MSGNCYRKCPENVCAQAWAPYFLLIKVIKILSLLIVSRKIHYLARGSYLGEEVNMIIIKRICWL